MLKNGVKLQNTMPSVYIFILYGNFLFLWWLGKNYNVKPRLNGESLFEKIKIIIKQKNWKFFKKRLSPRIILCNFLVELFLKYHLSMRRGNWIKLSERKSITATAATVVVSLYHCSAASNAINTPNVSIRPNMSQCDIYIYIQIRGIYFASN